MQHATLSNYNGFDRRPINKTSSERDIIATMKGQSALNMTSGFRFGIGALSNAKIIPTEN